MAFKSKTWRVLVALAFACLLALVPSSPAWADGQRDLQDAIRFYDNLDLERAVELFGRATRASDLSEGERALAHIYLGLAHFELGKPKQADAAWLSAFALAPGAQLPSGVSPKTKAAAERVRSQMLKDNGAPKEASEPAPGTAPKEAPEPEPVLPPEPEAVDPPEPEPVDPAEAEPVEPPGGPMSTAPPPPVQVPPVTPPPAGMTPSVKTEQDSGTSPWLWVGIAAGAAAVAGGVVAAVLLSSSAGDCPVGACITVNVK